MKWLKDLLCDKCDSEIVSATKYFDKHALDITECIAARNKYGRESLEEGCKNKPIRTLLSNNQGSDMMFNIVDRNAKFYADYRGCTSDVDNDTGKPENATLKDCNDVKQYWKSKGKESFINIPKKNNERVYVILFILAVFLFRKFKK